MNVIREEDISLVHRCEGRLRIKCGLICATNEKLPEIAKAICAIQGVTKAELNPLSNSILILHREAGNDVFHAVREIISFYSNLIKKDKQPARFSSEQSSKVLLARLAVSGATLLLGNTVFKNKVSTASAGILSKFTSIPSLVSLCLTAPLLKSAWRGFVETKRPNADFLTITSIVASILLGNSYSALTIIMLSDIAEFMTTYTIERTRTSIKKLLSVDEDYAWRLLETGEMQRCHVSKINIGDSVVIHTGEKVTVDGQIISGQALIDQSSTTGEFLPILSKTSDNVFAGSIVKSGVITVKTLKVGDDTVVSRIVNMVENVASQQAPIQHYADQFSNYLVPLNFLASIAVYLVTKNPTQALKMLVIDYSCGIKLSTAAAFSAAIHSGVKQGILIKGGAYLERMQSANTVIFDKTGTITEGRPEIIESHIMDKRFSEKKVIAYACAAEETSSHPLADAVLQYGKKIGVEIPVHGDVQTVVARGTYTDVDSKCVRVGSAAFMTENSIQIPEDTEFLHKNGIPLYVSVDKKLVGVIVAADRPRQNIRRAINNLRNQGIDEISIMTGDTKEQAKIVATKVGADSYRAELLPEQKASAVMKFQSEGNRVIMVGDGINDAPALAYADVGISLGSKSTDVAMETSDIVIGRNNPMLIPKVRKISTKTMSVVKQNFGMVIAINTLGLILGAASNISVFWSAMLHNMSTIAVVGNSCRLLMAGSDKEKKL